MEFCVDKFRGTIRFDLHFIDKCNKKYNGNFTFDMHICCHKFLCKYIYVGRSVRCLGICRHKIPQTVSSLRIIFRIKMDEIFSKYHICARRWCMSSVCSVAISYACKQTYSTFDRHRRNTLFSIAVSHNLQFHIKLRLFRYYNIHL